MILFWTPNGPMITFKNDFLEVEDLNPETKIRFRMGRGELMLLSWRCLKAAVTQARSIRGRSTTTPGPSA